MSRYADTLSRFARALDEGADVDALVSGSSAAGLAVYRNNLAHSLNEALMAAYPVLTQMVGADCMAALAAEYRDRWPQRHAPLLDYGADLPQMLAPHALSRQWPYLPSVARLEAAWLAVYHAADDATLAPAQLAALSPQAQASVVFEPRRASVLLDLEHAVHALWLAHKAEAVPQRLCLPPGRECVLLWRPGTGVHSCVVPAPAAPMVKALLAGCTLEAALALDTPDPVDTLQLLLRDGVFAGFHIDKGHLS